MGGASSPATPVASAPEPTATPEPAAPAGADPAGGEGAALFGEVCAACHGPDGAGVSGLGKNLIESEFVGALTDEQLLGYIREGRGIDDPLNTTGVAMPPSGGRPDLEDDQLLAIIAFLRTINVKAGVQSDEAAQYLARREAAEEAEPEPEAEEPAAGATEAAAAGAASAEVSGDAEAGQHTFAEVCAPCHGHEAKGIEGIGLDLTESGLVGGLTTARLADFIAMGRGLNNPFNTTGIRMPARGGRADLSDQDLLNIAAFLQSINTQVGAESPEAAEYLAWLESGGQEEIEEIEEVSSEGLSGLALDGQTTYLRFCAVCHGPRGQGVEGLGKSLIDSPFVTAQDDAGLAEFITVGRSADDPLNTTGIEMLPYGGQQSLTDTELANLVAFLRFVNSSQEPVAAVPSDAGEENEGEEQEVAEVTEEAAFAIIDALAPKCFTCHRISGRGNKNGPGPNLNGVGLRAGERVPGLSAHDYVMQSILDPSAFVVDECPAGPCVDVMPKNFGDQLSEEDLEALVTFLLSLPEEE